MEKEHYSPEFKLKAVQLYQKGTSAIAISKGLGICYASVSDWVKKYDAQGYDGLKNKAGGSSPSKSIHEALVRKVVETKKENPGMGAEKISAHLGRFSLLKVAANTIRKILQQNSDKPVESPVEVERTQPAETRRGRIKPRRTPPKRNKPKQVRYFERSSPNTLWQMDIMTFMLKGQYRIYLIGIIDDYSRFIVSHGLFRRQTESNVMEVVRAGMEKYKSPKEILTDNGRQFYSWRGKSKFTKFCIKAGIQHIRSRPYHPQTLGKIESFWRNLYQEYLGETPLSSFEEAQAGITNWIRHYNYKRVHLGIGGLVPADRFFGVSNQMEKLIREGAEETEKQLTENPGELKSPMYLVGKIGDREIRVVAKNGELVINQENTQPETIEPRPEKDVELCVAEHILHDGETTNGRDKTGEDGTGKTELGETIADGNTVIIDGGPAASADQRNGENGSCTISVERKEETGGSVQGTSCEQGRILQVDETGDVRDEGISETSRTGQESEIHEGGERAAQGIGEGEQAAAERKSSRGDFIPDSEDTGGMAERGESEETS